jgi:PAS domain S-box-containing protein
MQAESAMAGEVRANHNALNAPVNDAMFRQLAENIPALCWIADASGYISWYNPRWYEYTGTSPAQMQGWGWQSVHDPRSLAEVLERWSDAIASAKPFEMVFPIRGADGTLRPFLTRINPAFDADGKLINWFGVNTDISLQVRAEDLASKTEARFRLIADSMPQMVWSSTAQGHVDYFNARWYEFTGAPIGSTDGDGWFGMIHRDERDAVVEQWRRALGAGASFHMEHRLRHCSGEHRWVLARAHPERDGDSITRWYGTYTDIEEIVQARRLLQRSRDSLELEVMARTGERNLLATLVETTDVMIMAIDLDYNILAINRANAVEFERIYGKSVKAGDNLLTVLAASPAQLETLKTAWSRVLAGEEVTVVEHRGNPARSRSVYEIKYRPLQDHRGARIGAFQFANDITERIEDQNRLAQAQAALIESKKLEAMGQLTGGVAHDFNNLLTPIIGSLDMLQRREVGGPREQRLISAAFESAQRAKVLVQRLLAFARRQPLQAEVIDVGALIEGLRELLASTVGPRVALRIAVSGGALNARADANQLEMAVLNLAVNARDAIVEEGVIEISVSSHSLAVGAVADLAPGPYVRLTVADDGHGMDEVTLARAVEPFFSTKGIGQGTGLGLSMAHGLACQLGGTLTIASQPGRGTQVNIWLPQSARGVSADRPVELARRALSSGAVLLVDDEESIRLSTADMLSELGFIVHEADSAEAAIGAIDAGLAPDVLITDHLMSGMTGVELARRVRGDHPNTKIVIISGFADMEGIDPSLRRLTKPFVQSDLEAALRECQDNRERRALR